MLKAWKDEAEHGNDALPQTELSPDEGQVFDVEVQLGPLIGVIVCPHLDLGPARLDCTSIDGKKLDSVYADDVMLGVETDYAVSADGGHRDALESLDACFPGEAVRGEDAADGPGGDRLGLAALDGPETDSTAPGRKGRVWLWADVDIEDEGCGFFKYVFDDLQDELRWQPPSSVFIPLCFPDG